MASTSNNNNFLRYLRAFTGHSLSIVSGVLSVPLAFAGLYASVWWQKTLWGIAAIVAVLVAPYSIWLEQSKELEIEKAKNSRPILKGSIVQVYLKLSSPEKLQGNTRCDVEAFVKATLYNESHCPTTIRSFSLTVQDADGINESKYLPDASRWFIERGKPYQDSFGGIVGSVTEDMNALDVDTATDPVTLGRHRDGWLHFVVADMNPSSPEKGLYSLTAIDSFGANHIICCQVNPQLGIGEILKYLRG